MKVKVDTAQSRDQAGCRNGFSIIQNIQTIWELIGWTKENNLPFLVNYIDVEEGFDSIYLKPILTAWERRTIENPFIENPESK